MKEFIPCHVPPLSPSLWKRAAQYAISVNPANRSPAERLLGVMDFVLSPAHLALLTTKFWGAGGVKLGVQFLDNPDAETRRKILAAANRWSRYANISFHESASGDDVRLARVSGGGYWSYLGTDVHQIPAGQPTMNLEGFTANTPDSEYLRVVPHEFGHTCGFIHEHLRREIVADLDPAKTLTYFERTQGWSEQEVRAQVLTPAEEATLSATPGADRVSIMCYQLPAEITVSGQPIPGGSDIDETDGAFAAKLYPLSTQPPPPPPPPPPGGGGGRLFGLTFNRPVPKGGLVGAFRAPVAIPAGQYDVVARSARAGSAGEGVSPEPQE